ncbi:MAG: hypothetical protein IJU44_01680 [Kiritimatiellae bacterium]|nr:hypothetical protein [Kiritimatiellia bacterium]
MKSTVFSDGYRRHPAAARCVRLLAMLFALTAAADNFPEGIVIDSKESAPIRLETRDPDPMPEEIPETVAVEGGRLLSDTVWPTAATNFVLNTVVVPADTTLTVVTNACVFFAPYTGIKVEQWGTLRVLGSADGPVLFTATNTNDWTLTVLEHGEFSDSYAIFEKTTISSHPTVTLPAELETSERNGCARIPVNVSGMRDSAFRIKWRAIDGTAVLGEDYTLAEGEVEWDGTSDGAKYIVIPITEDEEEEGDETFAVEICVAEGANMGAAIRCEVLIRTAMVPVAVCAESEEYDAIRLETRDPDPMPEEIPETIAVEGGRLQADTVWPTAATNFVLNTVVIPDGVTLTVVTNACVFFAPYTGIKVEPGGALVTVGSQEAPVVFDSAAVGDYGITVVSGGTFADEWTSFRKLRYGGFGEVRLDGDLLFDSEEGTVRIPVYASGSRTAVFSVDWIGPDGTAGTVVWSNVSEGTKWITLPMEGLGDSFTVTLAEGRCVNIAETGGVTVVRIYENLKTAAVCAESEASDYARIECRNDGTLAKALVRGVEYVSEDGDTPAEAWDSASVTDGWQANGLLVRNDPAIAVEGGRLQEAATVWAADVTHLVRNWVVVPDGATLTIEAGAVVKFCEMTGIKVEPGGSVVVAGTESVPVVYTAAADDTIGGDSDLRETDPEFNDYAVNTLSGGSYTDNWCAIRYATFSNLGTATVPAEAIAPATDGLVRVPVFISTDRMATFCVDWRTVGGPTASGRLTWANKNGGTQFIDIPVTVAADSEFTVELFESMGINVSLTERKCDVKIYANDLFPQGVYAENADSSATRIETREYDSDLEIGPSSTVVIEGGRLQTGTNVWSAGVTHLVRNWVVVPAGATLTINAGTVVKFLPYTGIRVEPGGRVDANGTVEANIVFTSVADDSVGGDTDGKAEEPEFGGYTVDVLSGGTFANTETQMRYGASSSFGTISIEAAAVARKEDGFVLIPVYVPSSYSQAFSVDWVAHDGVAKFGEDYLVAAGRLDWSGTSPVTQYIRIPLDRLAATEENEDFAIELTYSRGINLNLSMKVCAVTLYDTIDCYADGVMHPTASLWSDTATVDAQTGKLPIFADGIEHIRYSTRWSSAGTGVSVTVADAGSNMVTLEETDSPAEGETMWDSVSCEDGRYEMVHTIRDAAGDAAMTYSAAFIVNRGVETHGGRLAADEIWTADKVHLVVSTVVLGDGISLTIEPGAIVKFMTGTGIVLESGAYGVCSGVVMTHAYDDVAGGDTFLDGNATEPEYDGYSLNGNWVDDAATEYRYLGTWGIARAVWTGEGGDDDVGNPANWLCYSARGDIMPGELPTERTDVTIPECGVMPQIAPGAKLICRQASIKEFHIANGGMMVATSIGHIGNGTASLWCDGGTIRAHDDSAILSGIDRVAVGPDGLAIDNGGYDVSIANCGVAAADAAGSLVLAGTGTTSLDSLPPVDEITVSAGTTMALSAGFHTAFADGVSPISDNVLPDAASDRIKADDYLLHRWSFNDSVKDSIGGRDADFKGNVVLSNGKEARLAGGARGSSWIDLGDHIIPEELGDTPFTIELWTTVRTSKGWAKAFSFGSNGMSDGSVAAGTSGLIFTYHNGGSSAVPSYRPVGAYQSANFSVGGTVLSVKVEYHIALTVIPTGDGESATVSVYIYNAASGAKVGGITHEVEDWTTAKIVQDNFWLGHSWWDDPDAAANFNEVRVWNAALSESQIAANNTLGADTLPVLTSDAAVAVARCLNVEAGASVDLSGNTLVQPVVSGAGVITNGMLTVTAALSPGGDGKVGTIVLAADAAVTGAVKLDVGDCIAASGELNLAGAKIEVSDLAHLNGVYVFATSETGGISGNPDVSVLNSKGYELEIAPDGKSARIKRMGTMFFVR